MAQTVEISLQIGVSHGVGRGQRRYPRYRGLRRRGRASARHLAASHFNLLEKADRAHRHLPAGKLRRPVGARFRLLLGMMPGVKRVGVIIERSI